MCWYRDGYGSHLGRGGVIEHAVAAFHRRLLELGARIELEIEVELS